ncbi:hypothetical protein K9L67_00360 [Candidatus Woesearchaeota archaeon]|nr:hypothetical protein [Candidatus Woesearchaeota archaeon]MCF7900659.1 hypothetical protein [Candidatus Woesearchaeota archaeon]MCF8013506.1 hypothetical protein [Candidatus Woesearchaeota archaeon]
MNTEKKSPEIISIDDTTQKTEVIINVNPQEILAYAINKIYGEPEKITYKTIAKDLSMPLEHVQNVMNIGVKNKLFQKNKDFYSGQPKLFKKPIHKILEKIY